MLTAKQKLDHVFHSATLVPIEATVLDEREGIASDHHPLRVRFRLADAEELARKVPRQPRLPQFRLGLANVRDGSGKCIVCIVFWGLRRVI